MHGQLNIGLTTPRASWRRPRRRARTAVATRTDAAEHGWEPRGPLSSAAFGGRRRREHRGGGGRERFFDAGDIKLVILKLLSEQPSYGYQLIKTMEERLAGGYTPSAGVIYPTLTMLEEEGLATASAENNRKVYSVTPEGLEYLQAHKRQSRRAVRAPGRGGKELRTRPLAGDPESVYEPAQRGDRASLA